MPSGRLTKVDMESRVLKIYEELNRDPSPDKQLAKKYLFKVLDAISEYSN